MDLWTPSEANLPEFREKPMSSTKWRALVFEIYERLNHVRYMVPTHKTHKDTGKILAVVDGVSKWSYPVEELNLGWNYWEKDASGDLIPI